MCFEHIYIFLYFLFFFLTVLLVLVCTVYSCTNMLYEQLHRIVPPLWVESVSMPLQNTTEDIQYIFLPQ